MLKLIEMFGITTTKASKGAQKRAHEFEKKVIDFYNEKLEQQAEAYSEMIQVSQQSIDKLRKEVDDLYGDIALALEGQELPDRKVIVVEYPSPIIHEDIGEHLIELDDRFKKQKRQKEMLKKLESKLKEIPDDTTGVGEITIINNGGTETIKFKTKKELEGIVLKAKNGIIEIAEQPGI